MFNDNNPDVLKQSAIFGEGTYKFTDAVKLTAGIRFFHFQIDNFADQAGLGTASVNGSSTILAQSASGNAVLPKLNLAYEPTPARRLQSADTASERRGARDQSVCLQLRCRCGDGILATEFHAGLGVELRNRRKGEI